MTTEILNALLEVLQDGCNADETSLVNIADVQTYEEAGVLTRDLGIVITMEDGTAFNLTVTQSA